VDAIRRIKDEDAILSIDFLAGFTIFILSLIMVISLVPGVLAGIQSDNIDYDAVAYRTSVILVEDPGAPDSWNYEWDYPMIHKADMQRLGLAVDKETPNILSRGKVNFFFNLSPDFIFSAEEYRDKVIFGDIPYLYNISLKVDGESKTYYAGGGTEVPDYQYGYMRRLVKVKEPSSAEINFTNYPGQYTLPLDRNVTSITSDFSVLFPYDVLINKSVNPAYRIDPQSERVTINLSNICSDLNKSDLESMNFAGIAFRREGGGSEIGSLVPWKNETYSLMVNEMPYPGSGGEEVLVNSTNPLITLILYKVPTDEVHFPMFVNFSFSHVFKNNFTDHTYLSGIHRYDYNTSNVTQPELKDAVMEVAIW